MSRRTAIRLAWGIGLLAVGLLVVAGPRTGGGLDKPFPRIGDPVPDFTLQDLEDRPVSLSSFRGKVVLLNFWASWCPPCLEEIPSLESLGRRLEGKPFAIVAASSDSALRPVERVVRQYGVTFLVLLDPYKEVAQKYGTFRYPETYLVDSEGKLVRKYIGPQEWQDPALVQTIESAIPASTAAPGTAATSATAGAGAGPP